MFNNIFRNPSTIYVILRSLRPEGGFASPKDVTIHYARIQFGIRLTLLMTIQEKYQRLERRIAKQKKQEKKKSEKLYEKLMK